jgi:hypothetical protein
LVIIFVVGTLGITAAAFKVIDAERRAADWKAKARAAEYEAEEARLNAALWASAFLGGVDVQAENAETRALVAALYGLPANRAGEALPVQDGVEPDVDLDFDEGPPNPSGSVILWERKKSGALVFHFMDPATLTAAERERVVSADEMRAMARKEWGPKKRKKRAAPDEDGAIPAGDADEEVKE